MAAVPVPVGEASHLELRDALGFLSLHLRCSPCSLLNNPTAHWFLGTHFAQHSKMPAHCASKQRWSLNPLWSQVVYGEVMITICNGWKRRELIPRSDGESEPRYNAVYLVEMYSAHKKTSSWRCIQNTGYLMEMYSTNRLTTSQRRLFNAEYLIDIYTLHRIYRTDDVFNTAGYFAQWMYSTQNISYWEGMQPRLSCREGVLNAEGFTQKIYIQARYILHL